MRHMSKGSQGIVRMGATLEQKQTFLLELI